MFVDRVNVNLRAGNGGAGVVAFKTQKGRPKGKPEGGSGGRGGDVYLMADSNVTTLLGHKRKPHRAAGDATHGKGDVRHGRNGDDLVVSVPLGTTVFDEAGVVVADLVRDGQKIQVLQGGKGGLGNVVLSGPAHRAAGFAEQGEYGQSGWFTLELKLIADAALIGFPNAGKSTFIAAVSAAKPKIADYPFTTLEPNLGVVSVGEREFVLADIPGLIEGAADGKGLGHEFLRHTERARALVVLLDPSPLQIATLEEQFKVLLSELKQHRPELMQRPRVTAVSKTELTDGVDLEQLAASLGEDRVMEFSSITKAGVPDLLHAIMDQVETAKRAEPEREGFVLHRPIDSGFSVARDGDVWVLEGRDVTRAVNLADLTLPSAADVASRRLTALGVDEALAAAGAVPGDDVRIGDLVFEFVPPGYDEESE